MVYHLGTKDATKIILVLKFREYGNGSTSNGILEVYAVGKVGNNADGVAHQEHPLSNLLIDGCFLIVNREKHQQSIQSVGI